MSERRLFPSKVSPEIYKTLVTYDAQIYSDSTLDKQLIELVKVRVSQLNGCAFCIDTHTQHALKLGIASRKLFLLDAWQEAPSVFTDKERSALCWAEALTFIKDVGAKDEYFESLKAHFTDKEVVDLTYLVGLVNVWNRLAIGMAYEVKA